MFIIVIVIIVDNRVAIGVQLRRLLGLGLGIGHRSGVDHRLFAVFAQLITKGRFKINHIAQQNIFAQQFITPNGDRLKCQRAFAQPQDHGVAPRLDAFGNRDLAFSAQQLNRPHLAQIHAHRIIRAIKLFGLPG